MSSEFGNPPPPSIPLGQWPTGRRIEPDDGIARRHRELVAEIKKLGWKELQWDKLEQRAQDRLVVGPKGALYREVLHAVAMSKDLASEPVDAFAIVAKGDVRFFKSTGGTVAELDEARAARAQAEIDRVERERAEAERGPQVRLALADALRRPLPTLREAAEQIHGAGGRIERGKDGSVAVTVPGQLTRPGWARGQVEHDERRRLADAALVISSAGELVLAELESSRNGQPLHERLPDRPAAIGGGIA